MDWGTSGVGAGPLSYPPFAKGSTAAPFQTVTTVGARPAGPVGVLARSSVDSLSTLPSPRIHEIEHWQLRKRVRLKAQVVQRREVATAERFLDLRAQRSGQALWRWQADPPQVLRLEAQVAAV